MSDVTTTQPDGAPPPARHRRSGEGGDRRPRTLLMAAVAVVLVAGGVIAYLVLSKDDGKKTPTTRPLPTQGQVLSGAGAQLATLLTNSRNHTFHARYAVRGDEKLLGGKLTMEWWNKNGHSRIDTTRTTDLQTVKTASFVNGTDGASCQEINTGGWTCQSIQVAGQGDPNGMIATLTAELSGRPVSEHAGTVKGHDALCFHVAGGTEPIDVCTDSDGVLLRNASRKVAYEIVSLDSDVSDSVFTPPAKVK
jgi:hypothetical protein